MVSDGITSGLVLFTYIPCTQQHSTSTQQTFERRNNQRGRYTNETSILPTWHQSQRDPESIVFIQAVKGNFDQLIPKPPLPFLLQTVLLIPGSCTRKVHGLRSALPWPTLLGTRQPPQCPLCQPPVNHRAFHTIASSHS